MTVTERAGGGIDILEKEIDRLKLANLEIAGRGRLLHPKSELAKIGHPAAEISTQRDVRFVPEGLAGLGSRLWARRARVAS